MNVGQAVINTELWDRVYRTDPKHTKDFKRPGGFSGTAIKPLYLIHKATEIWGPMGDKWGAETMQHVIHGNTVFILAQVWYPSEKEHCRATVQHWGGDMLLKPDKEGVLKPNDEAFKMAFTDAIGKCLVQLGFSADVHMGEFDGNKYVAPQDNAPTIKSVFGTYAEMKRVFLLIKNDLEATEDDAALRSVWEANATNIKHFKDLEEQSYLELVKIKDKQKQFLIAKKEEANNYQLHGA